MIGDTAATRRGDIEAWMGWRWPEPQVRAGLLMERLFIILAILVFAVAIVAVAAMAARGRREPLRMGSELDIEDEDLLIGSVGPRKSPIDRSAQVLDPRVLVTLGALFLLLSGTWPGVEPILAAAEGVVFLGVLVWLVNLLRNLT